MGVSAVVTAAGRSARFGGKDLKQFRLLGTDPLIFVTLRPFMVSELVNSVVVVVPGDAVDWMKDEVRRRRQGKKVTVIPGGAERQDSVWQGLKEIADTAEVVVVHDGVRPFLEERWIKETVDLCSHFDGAIVAVPATDTLKGVKGQTITGTVPREEIWQAQTPQTFIVDSLVSGYEHARSENLRCTDEAELVEQNGGRVAVVRGSARNMKITTTEDWELAESIWRGGEGD